MEKLLYAYDLVFGCRHRQRSRPFTLSGWTYEVCLECGKQFPYVRSEFGGNVPERKEEEGRLHSHVSGEEYRISGPSRAATEWLDNKCTDSR